MPSPRPSTRSLLHRPFLSNGAKIDFVCLVATMPWTCIGSDTSFTKSRKLPRHRFHILLAGAPGVKRRPGHRTKDCIDCKAPIRVIGNHLRIEMPAALFQNLQGRHTCNPHLVAFPTRATGSCSPHGHTGTVSVVGTPLRFVFVHAVNGGQVAFA